VFIEAKDDGCGGDNWTNGAISHAKFQSNHHHQQTNIQLLCVIPCRESQKIGGAGGCHLKLQDMVDGENMIHP